MNSGRHKPVPGLHFIATPIGAARDITLRALDLLAEADAIAADMGDVHGLAIIFDADDKMVFLKLCADRDGDRTGGARHAIFDGIFDQRLQDQCGHMLVHQFGRNVELGPQPLGVPDALSLQIEPLQIDFFF